MGQGIYSRTLLDEKLLSPLSPDVGSEGAIVCEKGMR